MDKKTATGSSESEAFPFEVLDILLDLTERSHSTRISQMQMHVVNLMLQAYNKSLRHKLVKPQGAPSDEQIEEQLMQATEFFFDPDKRTMIKKIHEARKAASVTMLVRAIPDLLRLSLDKKR